jgi:hypothetical protein
MNASFQTREPALARFWPKARPLRRIALYRRYLAEGTDADQASAYLRQLKEDEAELAAIAKKSRNRCDAGT